MNNVYYVYVHRRNDTNEVFYVGKGKNRRAYSKTGRNQHWCNIANNLNYLCKLLAFYVYVLYYPYIAANN